MSDKKYCKDCRWFIVTTFANVVIGSPKCGHEANRCYVFGEPVRTPKKMRSAGGCGVDGKYWEPTK